MITVEAAYARPEEQVILSLSVKKGSTLLQAIQVSCILQRFAEIDLAENKVGIFGKVVDLHMILREGDRVEIYRPLLIDPKQARRARVSE